MDLVIFEDSIKYDLGIKIVLVLSLALLIVLGILFYVDAQDSDIFPGEPAAESRTGSFVLLSDDSLANSNRCECLPLLLETGAT
jgi:hypothetical protein